MDAKRLWRPLLMVAAALLAGSPAEAGTGTVELVGTLPILAPTDTGSNPANGYLLVDSTNRRAFQLFHLTAQRFGVRSFDLDTFQPLVYATFDGEPVTSLGIRPGQFVSALDETSGRILVPVNRGGAFAGIVVIDGGTLRPVAFFDRLSASGAPYLPYPCTALRCYQPPAGVRPLLRGFRFVPAAFSVNAPSKLLLLLNDPLSLAESLQAIVWAAQWDAATGSQDWIHEVRTCGGSLFNGDSRYSLGIFESHLEPAVYLACRARGGEGQVVRLPQDATGRPHPHLEVAFPGPPNLADALEDPASNRMILRLVRDSGEYWWVFDGTSSSYEAILRITAAPATVSAGIDETIGRLYLLAPPVGSDPGGLMLSDVRSMVPPVARFPAFAANGELRIGTDAAAAGRPRRVFVLPSDASSYQVFADTYTP